jgi:hypothetical protein
MGADNHHDLFAAESQGGVDGVVDHRAPAHGMQHLGQRRFHPLTPPSGEDHSRPGSL